MSFVRGLIRIVTWPLRMLLKVGPGVSKAGGWLLNLSLPARVAILTAIFLVISVIVAFVAYLLHPERVAWGYFFDGWRPWLLALLVIVIPIVVYKVLKLWLEGDVSRWPDIDYAWQAGMTELERHGLDLSQIPLFLVLGSAGDAQEKALFDASGISFRMREVPKGPAALHWYANPDGVYLVCTQTSGLSRLQALAQNAEAVERAGPLPEAPEQRGGPIRGTIVAGGGESAPLPPTSGPLASGPLGGKRGAGSVRGTMVVSGRTDDYETGAGPVKRVVTLPPNERTEQERRLGYVCRLVRRARQPLCPINGVLTLLPFSLIQRPREAIELQRCASRDLARLRRVFMLRCPVTALVVGMEHEDGFCELVRRVGRDRAAAQRFGKGFSLWNPPIPERLEALAAHACGSFEDWVYSLFREKGALGKPGNTKLYSLLCKIRLNVRSRLGNILAGGYGSDPDRDPKAEPFLFGGCYFAAVGREPDRQAFVKGVFEKLPEQQEDLVWTQDALDEDDRFQRLAQLGLAVDTLLILALVGIVAYKWVYPWLFPN